jgi:hypothetical protein
MPTDYAAGLDFRVTKTTNGGYADYNTSKWARKESALTANEAEAIEKHGLYDLAGFLPKKPGDVELKVIKEMFEASVDGQPFDMERWGQYYRPAGSTAPAGAAADAEEFAPAPVSKPSPAAARAVEADDESAVASAPVATPAASNKAEDILAMIRSRQKQ